MTDPKAPHGYDADGKTPLAPFGLNLDGTPRKSNRGARPGQRGNRGSAAKKTGPRAVPTGSVSSLTDVERKGMLCELADMLVVSPLATASQAPPLRSKIGRHADALAGDAFILSQYVPGIADGLILLSKTKPRALAWLDKVEESAPFAVLAGALFSAGKAMLENHMNPNPGLAQAGRSLAMMKMAAMADAVNAQAARVRQEHPDPAAAEFEEAAVNRMNGYQTAEYPTVGG